MNNQLLLNADDIKPDGIFQLGNIRFGEYNMKQNNQVQLKTILIFADANRRAAITAARILKKQGCNLLFAIEHTFPERFTNLLFKKYYCDSLLKYDKSDFIDFLGRVEMTFGAYEILPVGEWQIRQYLINRADLPDNISLCIKNIEHLKELSDKETFVSLCKKSGLLVPDEQEQMPGEYTSNFVIKPKCFEDQPGVLSCPFVVDSKEAFKALKALNIDVQKHFIQTYVDGASVYYCAFYKEGARLHYFSQYNLVQQPNGKSVIKAEPIDLPVDLTAKIDNIFSGFEWTGPMMFELKKDKYNGQYYCIECNPRLWGPLQIAYDNGIDFVSPCFNLIPIKKKTNIKHGYIWLAGFLQGVQLAMRHKQSFQVYKSNQRKIRFRDLYFRKGSYRYFITELIFFVFQLIKDKMKSAN